MHVRFRVRYTFLFCLVVFTFWTVFWLVSYAQERRKQPKHWFDMDELSNDENELNGVGGTNLMIGMIKDENEQKKWDEGYDKHAFNELISSRLGNHRVIPDTRHSM